MSWHRTLANRATSGLLGLLMETVTSDGQTGYRAFSARALAGARIAHDYNYAQVLTLSLWGAGSSRWRSRSATGGAQLGARSCATQSISPASPPRSGASGGPRAPRAGRARPPRRRPPPPARTAIRRRV